MDSSTSQYQIATELNFDTDDPPLESSEKSQLFRKKYYPYATQTQWDDWKWQVRNSITSYDQLHHIFNECRLNSVEDLNLPIRITPYYASLITDLNHSIGKCVIPTSNELIISPNEMNDSLNEEHQSPVECIVHRYPDRVLFLTTDFCSSYCRYCTRSHMVSHTKITRKIWNKGIQYIKDHEEIRDVLLSGGDPLTLSDENLEYLLSSLKSIEHVEFLRIGTKVPVVLPQRITKNLCDMLKKYHPLFMSIHFSHPDELTPEVKVACEMLADSGIPIGSQTVLLKDVNDNVETMKTLMQGLLKIRVKPYYIYMCDLVPGTRHFRTTLNTGLQIMQGLRGWTSGYAVPQFIIDTPGGKIPLLPEYVVKKDNHYIILRNYEGKEFIYNEEYI